MVRIPVKMAHYQFIGETLYACGKNGCHFLRVLAKVKHKKKENNETSSNAMDSLQGSY